MNTVPIYLLWIEFHRCRAICMYVVKCYRFRHTYFLTLANIGETKDLLVSILHFGHDTNNTINFYPRDQLFTSKSSASISQTLSKNITFSPFNMSKQNNSRIATANNVLERLYYKFVHLEIADSLYNRHYSQQHHISTYPSFCSFTALARLHDSK